MESSENRTRKLSALLGLLQNPRVVFSCVSDVVRLSLLIWKYFSFQLTLGSKSLQNGKGLEIVENNVSRANCPQVVGQKLRCQDRQNHEVTDTPRDSVSITKWLLICTKGYRQTKAGFYAANLTLTQYRVSNALKKNCTKTNQGDVLLHWNQVSFISEYYHYATELCKSPRFIR